MSKQKKKTNSVVNVSTYKKMAMIGFAVVVTVLLNHTHLPVKNLKETEYEQTRKIH